MNSTNRASDRWRDEKAIRFTVLPTPIGPIAPAWRDDTLVALAFSETSDRTSWEAIDRPGSVESQVLRSLAKRFGSIGIERGPADAPIPLLLTRYFDGELDALNEIEADPGGSAFQSAIWNLLRTIPAGRTWTYGELAEKAGTPGAARAAGGVVGANPIPLVIPCHRIVGKNGALTGFGGGLRRKQWLLEHEGVLLRIESAGRANDAGALSAARALPRS